MSAKNCAQIYNNSIAENQFRNLLPLQWRCLKLDVELVWDSLFLFWLLEDYVENNMTLELDRHGCNQTQRISKGLEEHNLQFVGTGQPEWNHVCDSCCWVSKDAEGGQYRHRIVVQIF